MTRPDESRAARPRSRLPALLLTAAVVVAAAGLTLLPRLHVTQLDPTAAGTNLASRISAADVQHGHEVYLRDCAYCHGDQGEGSQWAPSLKHSGVAYVDFMLRTGRMPLSSVDASVTEGPPSYKEATIDALDAYVGTLTDGPVKPAVEPGDPYDGRLLFLSNCAPCHSSSGTGMIVTNGAWAPELFGSSPQTVGDAIRVGPQAMPPFTDKQLTADQVDGIATYVQQLGAKQAIGGDPIDQFGPIIEGMVAWLIPIPVLVIAIRLMGKRAR
jgi:ubiquinol-cytochrome c reductase cytochrome c subunit